MTSATSSNTSAAQKLETVMSLKRRPEQTMEDYYTELFNAAGPVLQELKRLQALHDARPVAGQ